MVIKIVLVMCVIAIMLSVQCAYGQDASTTSAPSPAASPVDPAAAETMFCSEMPNWM